MFHKPCNTDVGLLKMFAIPDEPGVTTLFTAHFHRKGKFRV